MPVPADLIAIANLPGEARGRRVLIPPDSVGDPSAVAASVRAALGADPSRVTVAGRGGTWREVYPQTEADGPAAPAPAAPAGLADDLRPLVLTGIRETNLDDLRAFAAGRGIDLSGADLKAEVVARVAAEVGVAPPAAEDPPAADLSADLTAA